MNAPEQKPRLTTSAMIASIAAEGQRTRAAPFGHALKALAESRPEIVGMTADLGKYTDIHPFRDACPDRFFNVGMAEQNLIAVGADQTIRAWGFPARGETHPLLESRYAHEGPILRAALSRDGRRLVTSGADRVLKAWTTNDFRERPACVGRRTVQLPRTLP